MARDDLAEIDVSQIAIFVDDRVEAVYVAEPADDLELLFVKRIADQVALNGERIFHETRGMEGADGFVVGDAGRDDLATAGPAGHEMRLDQAGGDAQIRFDEAAIELDRRSARRGDAEIDVIGVVARIVVLDSNPRHDPGVAHQFGKFFANVWPMQAGRDQNDDAVERNARGDQGFDHRPQEEMVGHGPRDVANQNAGALAPTGEFSQRRGIDRLRQRASNRRCGIDDFVELSLGDHGDFRFGGHAQRKMAAAVGNGDRFSHVGALVFTGQSLRTLIERAPPICQFQRRAASCQKKVSRALNPRRRSCADRDREQPRLAAR